MLCRCCVELCRCCVELCMCCVELCMCFVRAVLCRLVHDDSILQLHSIPEQMTFLSRSNHQIFFWKVQHVMSTFTVLW